MRDGASPHLRHRVAALGLCLAVLTSCSLGAVQHPRRSDPDSTLGNELLVLSETENHLYGHPHLWTPTAGLAETVYGSSVLAVQPNPSQPRHLKPSATLVAAARTATQATPLAGRWLRLELGRYVGEHTLGESDFRAVRALVQPAGWVASPDIPSPRRPAEQSAFRLENTALGAEILASSPDDFPTRLRDRIGDWLTEPSTTHSIKGDLCAAYSLTRATLALGKPLPESVAEMAQDWIDNPESRGRFAGPEEFQRTWCAVSLAARVHADLTPLKAALVDSIGPLARSEVSLQILSQAATMLRAVNAGTRVLQPFVERAASSRLADGSFPVIQLKYGTLDSSYYVQAIRRAAGISTVDPRLATAIDTVMASDEGRSASAGSRAYAAFAGEWAKGREPVRATRLVQLLEAEVQETTLAPDTVLGLTRSAELLKALGSAVAAIAVSPWPLDSREHLYMAALAVRAGGTDVATRLGLTAHRLIAELDQEPSLALPELGAYVGALKVLDYRPTSAERTRLTGAVSALRGCDRFRALFRATAADPHCDLRSTLAALEILDEYGE